MGSVFSPEEGKILGAWTTHYPYPAMGLIEALRQVQNWRGRIGSEEEAYLADLFKTTPAHVHEVASFFPLFTRTPTGRKRIGVCRGLSCALAGGEDLLTRLGKRLGVKPREATPDGSVSFEPMECLGACDHAPAVLLNEKLAGKGTDDLISGILSGQ